MVDLLPKTVAPDSLLRDAALAADPIEDLGVDRSFAEGTGQVDRSQPLDLSEQLLLPGRVVVCGDKLVAHARHVVEVPLHVALGGEPELALLGRRQARRA